MNTLIAVAIAPCGTGEEMSAYVGEVVRVIRESGLSNQIGRASCRERV